MESLTKKIVFPAKVIELAGEIIDSEIMLQPTDMQIGLDETHLMKIIGKGYIIFDFGKELNGCVRILTHTISKRSVKIRIRLGESVAETCAEMYEKGASNDHSLRDVETILVSYSDMEFCQSGFRFARIDFLEDSELTIKAVTAVNISRDLQPVGSFVCNDERINQIFTVASDTLMLNMQSYLWDGIKRDRLVWIGDMHPETLGIACLFGDHEIVEKSLTYVKEHTPLPGWMNRIPMYSLWWMIILYDYYMQNNNLQYVLSQKDYVKGLIEQFDSQIANDGSLLFDSIFFDWPSHDKEDEAAGVHALCMLAAQKSVKLCKLLGISSNLSNNIIDKLSKKQYKVLSAKQCEAFLVYAGINAASESYEFLTKDGPQGFSTFLSYYILNSIAKSGHHEEAVELMSKYYGGMLDMGATTFWEDFDVTWMDGSCPIDRRPLEGEQDIHGDFGRYCYVGYRHSLCHGWACGPIQFLMHNVAGINILEPGCKSLEITPNLGGLEWYTAKYPTPYGIVTVEMRKGENPIITAPKEIKVTQGI